MLSLAKQLFIINEMEKKREELTERDIIALIENLDKGDYNDKTVLYTKIQIQFPEYRKTIINYLIENKLTAFILKPDAKMFADYDVPVNSFCSSLSNTVRYSPSFDFYKFLDEFLEYKPSNTKFINSYVTQINRDIRIFRKEDLKEITDEQIDLLLTDERIQHIINEYSSLEKENRFLLSKLSDFFKTFKKIFFRYINEYKEPEMMRKVIESNCRWYCDYNYTETCHVINFLVKYFKENPNDKNCLVLCVDLFNDLDLTTSNEEHCNLFLDVMSIVAQEQDKRFLFKNILKFIKLARMQKKLIEMDEFADYSILDRYCRSTSYQLLIDKGVKPVELPLVNNCELSKKFIDKLVSIDNDIFKKRADILYNYLEKISFNLDKLYKVDSDLFYPLKMAKYYEESGIISNLKDITEILEIHPRNILNEENKKFFMNHLDIAAFCLPYFYFEDLAKKAIEYIIENDLYVQFKDKKVVDSKIKKFSDLSQLQRFNYVTYLLELPIFQERTYSEEYRFRLMTRIKDVSDTTEIFEKANVGIVLPKFLMTVNLSN